jgi:hypothetical protein
LTTRRTGLHSALKQYKGRTSFISVRQQVRLAALVGSFLERHGDCMAPDGYDVLGVVPSLQARTECHPMAGILRMIPLVEHLVVDPLCEGSARIERNGPVAKAYACRRQLVENRRILLVDDTYTTGAHLHSAAVALEDAGARTVRLLVVGRYLNWAWEPARRLLEWSSLPENRWSSQHCARCQRP